MIVLIVQSVPPGLRGELSKWMLEPQAGVFVGNVSGAVRELLWEKACVNSGEGSCTLIQQAANEQGYTIRTWGDPTRHIEMWEGLFLVRRPFFVTETEEDTKTIDWHSFLNPRLWAKTPRGVTLAPGEGSYHPLICHMVDSAMVASELWRKAIPATVKDQLQSKLGIKTLEDTEKWVVFFAGLHDLGKATPGFARKWDDGWKSIIEDGFRGINDNEGHAHYILSNVLLKEILVELGLSKTFSASIANILGGHHGTFPTASERDYAKDSGGKGKWPIAQKQLVLLLSHILEVPIDTPPNNDLAGDKSALLIIAGLTSVSDWIASNHDCFPYKGEDVNLTDYPNESRKYAELALERLGWLFRPQCVNEPSFSELFDRSPNTLQEQIIGVAENFYGPGLILLEYPMGGGKTEAALWLADYLASKSGQNGIYFALPTMATSNQMFGRVNSYLANRFPDNQVNTILLHGHASFNAEYGQLIETTQKINMGDYDGNDREAGLRAAEWFTSRKRGLLSPYGIGTIDQALLSVLQAPHFFVRLFGLAGKTVILDEVHAYDCYMQSLLSTMLTWLAACNTSVILLSATLPSSDRKKLLEAYASGRGLGQSEVADTPYPRVSWVSDSHTGNQHIKGASPRKVQLVFYDQDQAEKVCQQLQEVLHQGGCAAIILNTVNRAQQMYTLLKDYFPPDELYLFHARYPFGDRMRIETEVLKMFGPGELDRPHRAVLVATQVVEQSLDLDFDLMVSDIAPVDLVLQRSGRLWRHDRNRPQGILQPCLWLLGPDSGQETPVFEKGSVRVYDAHTLLRSWLSLTKIDSLDIPAHIEEMIEDVYTITEPPEEITELTKQAWRDSARDLKRRKRKEEDEASRRKIPGHRSDFFISLLDDLDEDDEDKHPALRALTRLGGPSLTVICLIEDHGILYVPGDMEERINLNNPPGLKTVRRLLEASLNISFAPAIVKNLLDMEVPRSWETSVHLRRCRVLRFDKEGTNLDGFPLVLDNELGMLIDQNRKEEM